MRDHTMIFLLIPLFVGVELLVACDSCTDTTPSPTPTTSTNTTVTPSSSSLPPTTAWAPVETLGSVADRWGAPPEDDGPWAYIKKGQGLYPWYVTFAEYSDQSEYNCGVYEQLQEDWRVAYCKGGTLEGGRRALRLTLHIKPDPPEQLRIQLSNTNVSLILGRQ